MNLQSISNIPNQVLQIPHSISKESQKHPKSIPKESQNSNYSKDPRASQTHTAMNIEMNIDINIDINIEINIVETCDMFIFILPLLPLLLRQLLLWFSFSSLLCVCVCVCVCVCERACVYHSGCYSSCSSGDCFTFRNDQRWTGEKKALWRIQSSILRVPTLSHLLLPLLEAILLCIHITPSGWFLHSSVGRSHSVFSLLSAFHLKAGFPLFSNLWRFTEDIKQWPWNPNNYTAAPNNDALEPPPPPSLEEIPENPWTSWENPWWKQDARELSCAFESLRSWPLLKGLKGSHEVMNISWFSPAVVAVVPAATTMV